MHSRRWMWASSIGLGLSLILWSGGLTALEAAPPPSPTVSTGSLYPSTPLVSDSFTSGSLAPFVATKGSNWSVSSGTLVGSNYGNTSVPIENQTASIPKVGENVVVDSTFTINQVDPSTYYRIGVFGRGSAPNTGVSQWDMVLDDGNLDLINQNVNTPASVPFAIEAGQSYQMMMVIDGDWVGGKIWLVGSTEPSQWTITGDFSNTGDFTSVGVASGHADVTFQNFDVYPAPPSLSVTPTDTSAVFPDTAPSYTATVTANDPSEGGVYYVNYVETNLAGTTVDQGQVPVTVPEGQSATATVTVPKPSYGYYQMTFSLTNELTPLTYVPQFPGTATNSAPPPATPPGPGLTPPPGHTLDLLPVPSAPSVVPPSDLALSTTTTPIDNSTTSMAAVPQAQDMGVLDSSSPFGINGPGTPATPDPAQWANVDQLLKEQGVQWIRTEFTWTKVEPEAGTFNWTPGDDLVEAGHQAQENLLGLVDYWGSYIKDPYSAANFSADVQQYDAYLAALVKRYMPGGTLAQQEGWSHYGITAWEIWNEPSTAAFWGGTVQQYAELVNSAAATIKAIEPNATILAYGWQPDVLVPLSDGAFTGVSIHDYPGAAYPSEAEFYNGVENLRQLLTENGVGSDPIWMTENGWSTNSVTETQQAEYIVRAAIQSLAGSLNKYFMFEWQYPQEGYGELDASLLPLPAYPAMAGMTDMLNGYTPATSVNPIQMGTAVRAFAFQDGTRSLVALWSPTQTGTLTLPPGPVSAYDWMGNPIASQGPGLTVPLSGEPVYLVANMPPAALAKMVQDGTIKGIAPVSLTVGTLAGSLGSLPNLSVTVTNQLNQSESGTLSLTLPSGWEAAPISTTAATYATTAATYTPSASFGPLAPSGSTTINFSLERFEANASNQYTVTASASVSGSGASTVVSTPVPGAPPSSGGGSAPSLGPLPPAPPGSGSSSSSQTVTTTTSLTDYDAVYGTAQMTGSLQNWGSALPLQIDQASQESGILNWTPSTLSATAYTMWSPGYLYFAAEVKSSAAFYEPDTGGNIWEGDSVQVFLDPENTKTTGYDAADGDTELGFSDTPDGNQAYEWDPTSQPLSNVKLTIVPGTSGGTTLYEAAIPTADLPDLNLQAGQAFGLDFLVNYNPGSGRVGWIWLTPGVGNAFDPADFPTFTLVNSASLAAVRLDAENATGAMTFTPNSSGALLTVTNNGVSTMTVTLSNGQTLTLNAASGASSTVTPSGANPTVPIAAVGTTTINLANYVSGTSALTLSASATVASGSSAVLTLQNGVTS
jgi:hypothetical protein